ncbi:MAG: SLC13 family permease [Aquificae bacterium]|nr:SLC13 family permease [Aquificota bacterium]
MFFDLESVLLLGVIIFLILALYKEIFHPAAVFFIAVAILIIFGILTPEQALAGFSNVQIATIILLLIVSNVIQKTGIMRFYFAKILKKDMSYSSFLGRMFLVVSSASSFLNNTPIVAMFIPYVYNWAKAKNVAPSKVLIPLSYAAILGGTITLIGTSTNLIVNGFMIENGFKPFNIFDFAYVGIPATIAGFLYMVFIGKNLLPRREDAVEKFLERKTDYFVETIVDKNSFLIGKTIKEAKLRNLEGLFLAEIIRKEEKISPVKPTEIIKEGDLLIFVGNTDSIYNLINQNIGISLPKEHIIKSEYLELVEIVISYNSSLINQKVKDTDFRGKYDATIIAIHRNGEKLSGKIGDIVLKPGDLLLVLAGEDFFKRAEDTTDFYIVSKYKEISKIDKKKGNFVFWGFLTVIVLSALKIIPLFVGLILLIASFVLFKIGRYSDIKKGLDINLVVIAALSLAIGKAMLVTGTADLLASIINSSLQPLGLFGALLGIYLITNILTEFVTNIAAASITFPIAISSASVYSVEPTAFALAVAYGASASFVTPIGYQTNLMVYAIGNYKFKDFVKVGLPLSIIYGIICLTVLYFLFLA